MPRIALNGLGRIGKLVLRALVDGGVDGEIVLLNDPAGTPDQHALLLEFDSIHGRWDAGIAVAGDGLTVAGRQMRLTAERRIEDLPLAELGVDLVIDCTGVFKTAAKIATLQANLPGNVAGLTGFYFEDNSTGAGSNPAIGSVRLSGFYVEGGGLSTVPVPLHFDFGVIDFPTQR